MKLNGFSTTILDALSEGIIIIDKKGSVKYCNPAYYQITGTKPEETLGKLLKKIRPGSRLPAAVESGKRILKAPCFIGGVEYISNVCPLRDEFGKIIGGVASIIELADVQEQYRIMDKFKSMTHKSQKLAKYNFDEIIYSDPESRSTIQLAKKVAKKDFSVLLTGESGTGKELYAHSIHNESDRADSPFVALNCAAFESNLLESELFGYEEGAFTGAKKGGKAGLFELANGGTLFLDEVSELNYQIQARLLRVLQERTIWHLGGKEEIQVDVRIIAASNKNLEDLVTRALFREDLYYRIAVIPLAIPPLRKRKGDIIPLCNFFIEQIMHTEKRPLKLSDEATEMLLHYNWPGNIRELKNVIQFGAYLAEGYEILPEHLPPKIQSESVKRKIMGPTTLKERIKQFEHNEIQRIVSIFGDTVEGKKKAAEYLGISLATLYNKLG